MLSGETFSRKMADLLGSLAMRDGSVQESKRRNETYYRLLCELNESDFIEACDRILWQDEWFPTIARIRAVASECAHERHRSTQAVTTPRELVCPYCHGSRWVRMGGYDPLNMQAGDVGSRVQRCPECAPVGVDGKDRERAVIAREGGVPNPNAARDVDLSRTTWRAPRTADGALDVDELYRQSRVLRGLDPNVDERPTEFGTFKTVGGRTEPEPARELATIGATDSMDDVPFD